MNQLAEMCTTCDEPKLFSFQCQEESVESKLVISCRMMHNWIKIDHAVQELWAFYFWPQTDGLSEWVCFSYVQLSDLACWSYFIRKLPFSEDTCVYIFRVLAAWTLIKFCNASANMYIPKMLICKDQKNVLHSSV